MWTTLVYVTCILLLPVVQASNDDRPVVTTSHARIIGTRLGFSPIDPKLRRSVDAYLGIPYAEAPVGALRFKPPVGKSWRGELQATQLGNRCPQPPYNIGFQNVTENFSEDCLFLDVFIPSPTPSNAAVLVFLHGGGYYVGAGTSERMLPIPIAAVGDVIVVTANYRLGALGFLSTSDGVISGNMGLLDQRLALEWVRDNIRAFGGDPKRVAIFGESAGAASVSFHMLSPGSAGLFHAAIMQSGDATCPWAFVGREEAHRRAFGLGKLVGCKRETSWELLECLQKVKNFNTFVENQHEKLHQELGENISLSFVPVADGKFLSSDPRNAYAKGAFNDAAVIIGGNADERMLRISTYFPDHTDSAPFVDSATYDRLTRRYVSALSDEPIVAEAIKLMYRDAFCGADAHANCDYLQTLSQVLGDISFLCGIDRAAKAFAKAGLKVYRYHMTHEPKTSMTGTKWTGATHLDDLLFVFGLPLVSSDEYSFTDDEARMSLQVIKYWTNLAKTGNPNLSSLDAELTTKGEEAPDWPVFNLQQLAYKDLSPSMLNGRGIKARECFMLNEFIPKLAQIADYAKKCGQTHKLSGSNLD